MDKHTRFIDSIWEGVFAADFTLEQVRRRCGRLCTTLLDKGWHCLVAYDTRFMSDLIARDIYRTFENQGIKVSLGALPASLPAVHNALSQHMADCALVVTAHNQPYWYNGLTLMQPATTTILSLAEEPDEHASSQQAPYPSSFPGTIEPVALGKTSAINATLDLRHAYIDTLSRFVDINLIQRATMTLFVDPMHGATAGYIPSLIGDESQTMAIEINRETDPLFNKLTPLPSTSSLTRLRKLVRESDSHVGLALSADGTALSVVEKNGEQLDQLETVLLLATYLSHQYRQKGLVIAPLLNREEPITMERLQAWQEATGLTVELTARSPERITEMLAQEQQPLLVGGTGQGQYVFGHYSRYPDALLAGLLIAEMIARRGGSLRPLLNDIRSRLYES